jgi:NADH dehydrogenase
MTGGPRILIVGGGYGGMHTALRLERLLRRDEAEVTIADPRSYMTCQPLLAEAAAGNLEPRHVVVPLRGVLRRTQVIKAAVSSVDHERRVARLAAGAGAETVVGYDLLVLAPGSVSRVHPIPGLAEAGIGFKTIGEAIHLRNHVLGKLDAAAAASGGARRAALTFVFVGGGYAGVEALAGLQDMAFGACARYPELSHRDMRWILVEAADRILPEVSTAMAGYTADLLRRRHIEVRLQTRLASAEGGQILLDDGEGFPAGTLVWTAGAAPSPLTSRLGGLATDDSGRVIVNDYLAVKGADGAWALGDAAAVPYLAAGAAAGRLCAPTAQHAYRQASRLAGNIAAVLRGHEPRPYWHASAGSAASLGLYCGVAEVYGLRMRGFPAWITHRTCHLLRLPTLNRRLHVISDWTLALMFHREIVSLDVLDHPRQDFQAAPDLIASGPPRATPSADADRAGNKDRREEEAERAHHQQAETVPPDRVADADAGLAAAGGNGPGVSAPGSSDGWARACPLAKLRERQSVHVDIGECQVCVVLSNGTLYAVHDECTHQAVPLSDGDVTGGTIECCLHGSRFDLATGRALSRPATQPVDVYPVRTDGNDVFVRLGHLRRQSLDASPGCHGG